MILLIDNSAKNSTIDHFRVIFKALEEPYDVMNSDESIDLDKLKTYTGIIASGGPWDLTQPVLLGDFKLDLQALINLEVPYYGICMGHQILSEANGADIGKWPEEYHDWRQVTLLDRTDLFKGLDPVVSVMEWHQEYVVAPAPGFELIATSDACFTQGTRHTSKHIYSTQFHPELSGETGFLILSNFIDICNQRAS